MARFVGLLALVGCTALDNLKEDVEGLTNPVVLEALVVGVAPPDSDAIDLAGTGFEEGVAALVMVADASSADTLADAPVEGATVAVVTDDATVELQDEGSGQYAGSEADGLTYVPGALMQVHVAYDGGHTGQVVEPPAPDAVVPANAQPGTEFEINIEGQDFDSLLVVVVDGANGDVTFDNRPESIDDLYNDFVKSPTLSVVVPASATARESVYLVGVAGLVKGDAGSFADVNTALSMVMAGRLRFYPLNTTAMPG